MLALLFVRLLRYLHRFCCGCPIPCRVTVNGIGGADGVGKGAPVADQIER